MVAANRALSARGGASALEVAVRSSGTVERALETGANGLSDFVAALRLLQNGLIAAAPVASKEVSARAANVVDDYVFLATPKPFHSVGFWYEDTLRQVARAVFAGPNEARVHRKQPA